MDVGAHLADVKATSFPPPAQQRGHALRRPNPQALPVGGTETPAAPALALYSSPPPRRNANAANTRRHYFNETAVHRVSPRSRARIDSTAPIHVGAPGSTGAPPAADTLPPLMPQPSDPPLAPDATQGHDAEDDNWYIGAWHKTLAYKLGRRPSPPAAWVAQHANMLAVQSWAREKAQATARLWTERDKHGAMKVRPHTHLQMIESPAVFEL